MCSSGMAIFLRRLLILCFAAALLVGGWAQLLPCSMAEAQRGVGADMAAGCAGRDIPCANLAPGCIDHIGCVVVPALPVLPNSLPVALRWTAVAYAFTAVSLAGLTVEPELSPPILAA